MQIELQKTTFGGIQFLRFTLQKTCCSLCKKICFLLDQKPVVHSAKGEFRPIPILQNELQVFLPFVFEFCRVNGSFGISRFNGKNL